MDTELQDRVLQWKNKLENEHREDKILRLLQKLQRVPISINLLMSTEIGRVVNKMRKRDGEIGEQAKSLVSQWKDIVSSQKTEPDEQEVSPMKNPYLSSSHKKCADSDYDPNNASRDYSSFKHKIKADHSESSKKQQSKSPVKSEKSSSSSSKLKNGTDLKKKSKHSNESKDSSESHKKKHNHTNGHVSKEDNKNLKRKSGKSLQKKIKDCDDFDNQTASFEACLSFNDVVPIKKKKIANSVNSNGNSRSKALQNVAKELKKEYKDPKVKSSRVAHSGSNSSCHNEDVDKIDVLSTLPKIQPNYKPMPTYEPELSMHNFKSEVSNVDDDMFSNSKSSRTKLYSGRVTTTTIPEVISLQDFCIRVLSDNIDSISYLGNVPYFIMKPVLENCTANQLADIEYYNPYLIEETDELWQILSIKKFRGKLPDEFEDWREMYHRLSDEREARLKSITANISASMAKATPVRQTKLAYVDTVAKPPRNVARAQAKQGTGLPVGYKMKAGPPGASTTRPRAPAINSSQSHSNMNIKKVKPAAPLMQKTLKFMKNRFRR